MFKGKKGAALAREMGKRNQQPGAKTFVPGAPLPVGAAGAAPIAAATAKKPVSNGLPKRPDVEAIKQAISEAKTLEEIERLNKLLQAGTIPGFDDRHHGNGSHEQDMEV